MYSWIISAALIWPLQLSYAFYPYHLPDFSTSPSTKITTNALTHGKRQELDTSGLKLGLKRLKYKRDNGFSTISAATPRQANSLGVAEDGTDFSYFCSVQFGSSPKTFLLLLDSAASNTWVMGSGCQSGPCGIHTTLGSGDSSSLKTNSDTFSVTYGTGMVAGSTASDTLKTSAFVVPFTFGLANQVSNDFNSYAMDGILALGRADQVTGSDTNVRAPGLLDVLVSQKVITSKLFGLHLWRSSDGGSNDGEINFGAPDTSKYSGNLNYITTVKNTNGFWEIAVDDAGVDGKKAGLTGRTAIIDSGTSFVLMPTDDAAKLHALISGSAQNGETFTIPCTSQEAVQITFGGQTYSISPKDYVGKSTGSGGNCVSNIVGHQTFSSTQWLVGDVFLKNVYAVFDFDNSRVGFGTSGGSSSAAASSSSVASTSSTSMSSPQTSSAASSTSPNAPSSSATASVSMVGLLPSASSSSTGSSSRTSATSSASSTPTQTSSATGLRTSLGAISSMTVLGVSALMMAGLLIT